MQSYSANHTASLQRSWICIFKTRYREIICRENKMAMLLPFGEGERCQITRTFFLVLKVHSLIPFPSFPMRQAQSPGEELATLLRSTRDVVPMSHFPESIINHRQYTNERGLPNRTFYFILMTGAALFIALCVLCYCVIVLCYFCLTPA